MWNSPTMKLETRARFWLPSVRWGLLHTLALLGWLCGAECLSCAGEGCNGRNLLVA